ncbi:SDR family NAD(P)-dependent oxidoreductase [Sediminibacillus dalangtanensis]|uniref:SDR family NAD(P)-dependent oxidoreductase n=1 Tax=Sediminibacillus dalangtanensis TaxID=2729421 RepID=A0ABX7VQA5_9BACI|nr:SDR family NAD(P)-dependent oxidoreductase [Sediminibacillus dalangtanensis]QTM97945.1 SDR family NAD(P)-dependent oxidoreductase [Sediminibacillus dalangtanensis]
MNSSDNTILITGGSSGIGLALAARFLDDNNNVIIVGRNKTKLEEAKQKYPQLHIRVCDIADEADRIALFKSVKKEFPAVNILVNNAGIQQRANILQAADHWADYRKEISINVDGPIHLSMLFAPHLAKQENAAIINVSSGLAFTPGVWVPVYSATKAAIHSFTMSLRLQLAETGTEVIEVLPPAVNTDLGGEGLHTFGADLNKFADSVYSRIKQGDLEIGFGASEKRLRASREELEEGTKQAWENFLKNNPDFL